MVRTTYPSEPRRASRTPAPDVPPRWCHAAGRSRPREPLPAGAGSGAGTRGRLRTGEGSLSERTVRPGGATASRPLDRTCADGGLPRERGGLPAPLPNRASISVSPMRSTSSGMAISPAGKPGRWGAAGASSAVTFTSGLPAFVITYASPLTAESTRFESWVLLLVGASRSAGGGHAAAGCIGTRSRRRRGRRRSRQRKRHVVLQSEVPTTVARAFR